ncbi:MAG: cation diffusion facilitator family transporter [Phycisphaeraceae bacterium]
MPVGSDTAVHSPSHQHTHDLDARNAANRRRLLATLALAATYMVVEFVAGILSNSLALLADAGHMLSDVAALALSLFASWYAHRPPPIHRTYGNYRAEILAAMVNGAALIAIAILIFIEAYERLADPPQVRGALMMGVAVGGLLVNLAGLWILHGGRQGNLNMRGAWLHVLTDAMGSVGAIAAALLIWLFGWLWADPVTSILIGLLVIYSSWRLLAESISVLMNNAPMGMNVSEVRAAISAEPGVESVHDLHLWTIANGLEGLSAHVVLQQDAVWATVLARIREMIHDRFGIDHTTIQVEPMGLKEHPVAI